MITPGKIRRKENCKCLLFCLFHFLMLLAFCLFLIAINGLPLIMLVLWKLTLLCQKEKSFHEDLIKQPFAPMGSFSLF